MTSYNALHGKGNNVTDPNLILAYDMQDGAGGSTVAESSGHAIAADGITEVPIVQGNTGPASYLPSSIAADHVQTIQGPSVDAELDGKGEFTAALWAKVTDAAVNEQGFFGDWADHFLLRFLAGDANYFFIAPQGSIDNREAVGLETGVWQHHCLRMTPTIIQHVMNGVGSTGIDSQGRILSDGTGKPFLVMDPGHGAKSFAGEAAGFRLWTRALSDAEIAEVIAGPEPYATIAPSITSGEAVVDEAVDLDVGTWADVQNGPQTITIVWSTAPAIDGLNPTVVQNGGTTYTPVAGDEGRYLFVEVTNASDGGTDPVELYSVRPTNDGLVSAGAGPPPPPPEPAESYNELMGRGNHAPDIRLIFNNTFEDHTDLTDRSGQGNDLSLIQGSVESIDNTAWVPGAGESGPPAWSPTSTWLKVSSLLQGDTPPKQPYPITLHVWACGDVADQQTRRFLCFGSGTVEGSYLEVQAYSRARVNAYNGTDIATANNFDYKQGLEWWCFQGRFGGDQENLPDPGLEQYNVGLTLNSVPDPTTAAVTGNVPMIDHDSISLGGWPNGGSVLDGFYVNDAAIFEGMLTPEELTELRLGPEPYATTAPSTDQKFAAVGIPWHVDGGVWDDQNNGDETVKFAWFKSDFPDGSNPDPIITLFADNLSSSYTPTDDDVGSYLFCTVTKQGNGGLDPLEEYTLTPDGGAIKPYSSFNQLHGIGGNPKPDDLLVWLPLMETSGTAISDYHGEYLGSLFNVDETPPPDASALAVAGPSTYQDSGLKFNGNAYADVGFFFDYAQTKQTTILLDVLATDDSGANLVFGHTVGAGTARTTAYINYTDNDLIWDFQSNAGRIRGDNTAKLGVWGSYALIGDRSGDDVDNYNKVFVDDQLLVEGSGFTDSMSSANRWLFGGAGFSDTEPNVGATAGLANIGIWNRILEDYEREQHTSGPEPVNATPPQIVQDEFLLVPGESVSITNGTWDLPAPYAGKTNGALSFVYQWFKSIGPKKLITTDIPGENGTEYTVKVADVGYFIGCRVTAINDGGYDREEIIESATTTQVGPLSYNALTAAGSHNNIKFVQHYPLQKEEENSKFVFAAVGPDATITGEGDTTTNTVAGPDAAEWLGESFLFNNAVKFLQIGAGDNLSDLRECTVSFWMQELAAGSSALAFTAYNTNSPYEGFGVAARLSTRKSVHAWNGVVFTDSGLHDVNWHHHAVTLKNGLLTFYKDGLLVLSETIQEPETFGGTKSIGGQITGANVLVGSMADFQVYTEALDIDAVNQLLKGPEPVPQNLPTLIQDGAESWRTLECVPGTYSLPEPWDVFASNTNGDVTVYFQWYRSETGSINDAEPIDGATDITYQPIADDYGMYLRCETAGGNNGGIDPVYRTATPWSEAIETPTTHYLSSAEHVLGRFQGTNIKLGAPLALTVFTHASGEFEVPFSGVTKGVINWGDGTSETIDHNSADPLNLPHTYPGMGEWEIEYIGKTERINFTGSSFAPQLLEIVRFDADTLGITSMETAFDNCTSLKKIHDGAFDKCGSVTTIAYAFRGTTSLKTLPPGVFENFDGLAIASYAFDASGLEGAIEDEILADKPQLLDVDGVFAGCFGITSFGRRMFASNPLMRRADLAMTGCTGVAADLPGDTFEDCPSLTNCFALIATSSSMGIEAGLFDSAPLVNDLKQAFDDTTITAIPAGLLLNVRDLTDAERLFQRANLVGRTPDDLLINCDQLTTVNSIFAHNGNLTGFDGFDLGRLPLCTDHQHAILATNVSPGDIDAYLVAIDLYGPAVGTLDYSATLNDAHLDSARSGQAMDAVNSLIAKGWTRNGSY